ncbi:hypothetical protein [Kitasatospora sp. A2-31]|uniref:hypothetical protein n=1 Tax=Kitasatospora sp. A2-31 TaxID=2916414 RepID=UPI001EEB9EAF|nr:hypothetical protein [Kitasatospora sp. A2-31]MCG6495227.1 hypothetical protein [Kitasatospora sp. A2-31]
MLATLCAAPTLAWVAVGGGTFIDGPLVLGSLATPAPLFARDADNFRTACRIVGCGVLAGSAVGLLFGMFMLVPAGVVLLAAASRSRPGSPRLPMPAGAVVLLVTLVLAGWAFGRP